MTTQIRWYNNVTYTSSELYDTYGFGRTMPCGLELHEIVHICLTQGRYDNDAYGLPILLNNFVSLSSDRLNLLVEEKIAEIEAGWRNFGSYREARIGRLYVGDCGALGFVILDNDDGKYDGEKFESLRAVAERLIG